MDKTGPDPTILETKGLTKSFGWLMAVNQVDMHVSQGEVLSIVGPNGAGKTTLLKLLSGGHLMDSGTISFAGRDLRRLGLIQRARMGIVYSFQIPALFENLSAMDCVRIALLTREHKTVNFFSMIGRFSRIRKETQDILQMFNVPENRVASELPHGQRKLLDVAMAFALMPRILLLDEPTSGVSTREKGKIMDTIMPVISQGNTTVLIVEHDMEIVERYSQRVIVMDQGQVFCEGTPGEVMCDQEVRRVLLGHGPLNEP